MAAKRGTVEDDGELGGAVKLGNLYEQYRASLCEAGVTGDYCGRPSSCSGHAYDDDDSMGARGCAQSSSKLTSCIHVADIILLL